MIATVSPGASSADHTLNTLRYADRIKEKKVGGSATAAGGVAKRTKTGNARPKKKTPKAAAPPPSEQMDLEPMLLDDVNDMEEDQYDDDFDLLADDDEEDEQVGGELDTTEKLHSSVVQSLYEQEEELLNMHMASIQVRKRMDGGSSCLFGGGPFFLFQHDLTAICRFHYSYNPNISGERRATYRGGKAAPERAGR